MVKVDLITGFLGSGKTTFIRKYVQYLLTNNEKICVLENDYGAINVDAMLLNDLKNDNLAVEMIAGGCDYDCHIRRFKTKLITLSLLGFNRVIVEPSGVFDVDEFYDILNDDNLAERFEVGNVIAIVNPNDCNKYSLESQYLLASQIATCGLVVFSHVELSNNETINNTLKMINDALEKIKCQRIFDLKTNILAKSYDDFTGNDFKLIASCGYKETGYLKLFSIDTLSFQSLFFMNIQIGANELLGNVNKIWQDEEVGNIIRIKGFIEHEDKWLEINSIKQQTKTKTSDLGQSIIIVIGENLNAENISKYIPCQYSSFQVETDSQKAIKKS